MHLELLWKWDVGLSAGNQGSVRHMVVCLPFPATENCGYFCFTDGCYAYSITGKIGSISFLCTCLSSSSTPARTKKWIPGKNVGLWGCCTMKIYNVVAVGRQSNAPSWVIAALDLAMSLYGLNWNWRVWGLVIAVNRKPDKYWWR